MWIFLYCSGGKIRITQLDVLFFMCIAFQEWLQSLAINFEFVTILRVNDLDSPVRLNGLDNEWTGPT